MKRPSKILVDGFWIRTVFGDMDFNLLGCNPDWSYHWYIPKHETWIEKRSKKESTFLLATDTEEQRLYKKTGAYWENRAKLIKKFCRKTSESITRNAFYKNGLLVRIVNGALVRKSRDYGFVMGGHFFVYPSYIPKNEIWVDDRVPPDERKYILAHEITEYELMKKGLSYNQAHDRACEIETKTRAKDKNLFSPAQNPISPLPYISFDKKKKRILLIGGVHGDEPSGPLVLAKMLSKKNYVYSILKKYSLEILPLVNPTGFLDGTRKNKEGKDLNRWFFDTQKKNTPREVQLLKNFFKKRKEQLDFFISLHEDYDRTKDLYVYDSGNGKNSELIQSIFKTAKKFGLKPFNGIDDPELRNEIRDEYIQIKKNDPAPTLEEYIYRNKRVKKGVTIELPGKLPLERKIEIGSAILKALLKII